MSVVIGCDPHKRSHTAVAVDGVTGAVIAEITVASTDPGHRKLLDWGRGVDGQRRWAVEDCRHVCARLLEALLAAGEDVVAVPPKMMAGTRRSARQRGKSDAIDARAVALALLREPKLPLARLHPVAREIKVLLAHREDLVAERTRVVCRLRWHLHELGLEADVPAGSLDRPKWLDRVGRRLAICDRGAVVEVARDLVRHSRRITREVLALEPAIATLVAASHPELLHIPGCGPLTAAKIVAEIASIDRFPTEAKLAMHAGVAPIPCATGRTDRFRLNRSGNRQLNLAVHRIALVQGRIHEPARAYLARRQAEGRSRREAMRCLKRHIVRRVYNVMKEARCRELLT